MTREVWDIMDCAELYIEHGLPPVAGGVLDQTASFIDACKFIDQESRPYKQEASLNG